jgi:hypothetical protein
VTAPQTPPDRECVEGLLRQQLEGAARLGRPAAMQLDAEAERQLKALGYLQ